MSPSFALAVTKFDCCATANSWAGKPALPWQAAQKSNHVTNLSCSIIAHSTGSLIWWFYVSSSSPFSAETLGIKYGKIKTLLLILKSTHFLETTAINSFFFFTGQPLKSRWGKITHILICVNLDYQHVLIAMCVSA